MKKNSMNPYLPLYEYIPDAEPHIFGDRLYVYGSHDFAGGEKRFCPGDYMIWSAPLDDLSEWQCDGVGFKRADCPNLGSNDAMAAPDVVKGCDGRYYMYWNTNEKKVCHVAVSDIPEGPFAFYGDVQMQDGIPYEMYKMFDPGVFVDDDQKVYLYTGFCMVGPVPEQFKGMPSPFAETSIGFELASDMITILKGPIPIIPGANEAVGTEFEGHGFFEASSPRKINEKYVMVYSSEKSHDLAYAIAKEPLGKYQYMGILISNADIGLNGNEKPVMPYGNNHGGLVEINKEWYIFYHRQTHAIECSRQGCVEKLKIREDGWFDQVEITSLGFNQKPFLAEGTFQACYCCYLVTDGIEWEKLNQWGNKRATEPHIFEEKINDREEDSQHYIANILNKTVVGYKYFSFNSPKTIQIRIKGTKETKETTVTVHIDAPDGEVCGSEKFVLKGDWENKEIVIDEINGVHALYFEFEAAESIDFMEFTFI